MFTYIRNLIKDYRYKRETKKALKEYTKNRPSLDSVLRRVVESNEKPTMKEVTYKDMLNILDDIDSNDKI